jgi:hypothetical protein
MLIQNGTLVLVTLWGPTKLQVKPHHMRKQALSNMGPFLGTPMLTLKSHNTCRLPDDLLCIARQPNLPLPGYVINSITMFVFVVCDRNPSFTLPCLEAAWKTSCCYRRSVSLSDSCHGYRPRFRRKSWEWMALRRKEFSGERMRASPFSYTQKILKN